MRFDLVSDLHMEHWDNNYDILKYKQSSILVVAGDVASDPELTSEWLTIAAAEYKHVLFVCGNHEHTKSNFDLDKSYKENEQLFTIMPNVHLLYKFPFIYKGVAFVGANGWWDYRLGEPHVSRDATYNYYKPVWGERSLQRTLVQGSEDYTYIMDHCSELNSLDSIQSIVVVTHTIPHLRGVDWVHGADNLNIGCFGNKKMEQIPVYFPKVKHWLFGHNHNPHDFVVHNTHYISHPRGRPGDTHFEKYKPRTIIV